MLKDKSRVGYFLIMFTLVGCVAFAQKNIDIDKDGIFNQLDNCLTVANSLQRDSNGDGIGNFCDADLDNNGRVDSKDLVLFERRVGTNDPDADIDGNGTVNDTDYVLFKDLLLKEIPGPSNTIAEPSFVLAPPPASKVAVYKIKTPKNERENAVLMASYERVRELPSVIPISFESRTIALNDMGVLPDRKAGDHIYTAFTQFDFDNQESSESSFEERFRFFEADHVVTFSGRNLITKEPFKLSDKPLSQGFGDSIELADGTLIEHVPFPFDEFQILPPAHDASRSLMITDPAVIADPTRTFDRCDTDGDGNVGNVDGVWSFKTLMSNMAPPGQEQQFIHNWLRQLNENQTVNGFTLVGGAPFIQEFFVGWDGVNASTLDMDNLPFRLLSITNRIDLSKASAYGVTGNPGEIRLVYGIVLPNPGCGLEEMTVIFEYEDVQGTSCSGLKSRANQWLDLSALTLGSASYNTALQNITDDVTARDAAPAKPNGHA